VNVRKSAKNSKNLSRKRKNFLKMKKTEGALYAVAMDVTIVYPTPDIP